MKINAHYFDLSKGYMVPDAKHCTTSMLYIVIIAVIFETESHYVA